MHVDSDAPTRPRDGSLPGMRRGRAWLPSGPALLLWVSAALLVMTGVLLGLAGTGEGGVRMLIRATARTSLVLFLLAFLASSLQRRWPSPATRYLVRNRRHLGFGLAVSHGLHLLAILTVAWRWPHPFLEQSATPPNLIGGGLGYLFLAAMVATSTDGPVRRLGARRWRLLHLVGGHYIWLIFALTFVGRVSEQPLYLLPVLLLLGALGLRLWARATARAR